MSRPSVYSERLASAVLSRLADGESLRVICADKAMPSRSTVKKWNSEDIKGFSARYARARDEGLDVIADEIIEISDEAEVVLEANEDGSQYAPKLDATAVARNRLRVDARKWYLSKLAPKRYGEKQQVEHSGGLTLEQLVLQSMKPADDAN